MAGKAQISQVKGISYTEISRLTRISIRIVQFQLSSRRQSGPPENVKIFPDDDNDNERWPRTRVKLCEEGGGLFRKACSSEQHGKRET